MSETNTEVNVNENQIVNTPETVKPENQEAEGTVAPENTDTGSATMPEEPHPDHEI
jgi:hypothetical protein